MCKVVIIPAIKQPAKTAKFIETIAKEISVGNTDGLGYAAVTDKGDLYGERWLVNSTAFHNRIPDMYKMFSGLSTSNVSGDVPDNYNSFGVVGKSLEDAKAITLHTRYATSSKGFQNTHPFVDGDTSLIHNGIISNTEDFNFKLSSCDSEAILISYLKHDMNKDLSKAVDVAKDLTGYYVAALFSRDAAGNRVLDIMKGNNESFNCVWVNELETYVFASSEKDIQSACKELGYTYLPAIKFKDGLAMRLCPFTGELLGSVEFTPGARYKPYTPTYTRHSYADYGGGFRNVSKSVEAKRNLSPEMIAYLKHKPSIKKIEQRTLWGWEYE
jgi:hypothetical protein